MNSNKFFERLKCRAKVLWLAYLLEQQKSLRLDSNYSISEAP